MISCFWKKKLKFVVLLFSIISVVSAQDGKLDPTFNPDAQPPLVPGEAVYRFGILGGTTTIANAVVTHYVDGEKGTKRIVIGGSWQGPRDVQPALLIIDEAGNRVAENIDVTLGNFDAITALAVQPDNKIIAIGRSILIDMLGNKFRWFVARYTSDAQLDTTFNPTGTQPGVAFVDFTPVAAPNALFVNAIPQAVALTREGKIVAVGGSQYEGGNLDNPYYFAVSLLNQDGTLDSSFAAGAGRKIYGPTIIAENASSGAYGLAIQSTNMADNFILAGQGTLVEDGSTHMQLVRILPNGDLDLTFGLNGVDQIVFDAESSESASGVDIYPDGKIMVVGNGGNTALIAKRLINGGPDINFGTAGKAIFRPDETPVSCAALNIQNNGDILMAGLYSTTIPQFMTWRFNGTGNLDTTFNPPLGYVLQSFIIDPEDRPSITMGSLALQGDGRVVIVGTTNLLLPLTARGIKGQVTRSNGEPSSITVFRYLNNNMNASDPQIVQVPTFTSPENAFGNSDSNPPTLAGAAQNPSNITIYANGCEIGRTVTQGPDNTWTFQPSAPLQQGSNTFKVVAEYKSGNMNLAATTCCAIDLGPQSCISNAIREKYCPCPDVECSANEG